MSAPHLALRLRDRLGPEASDDLSDAFKEAQNDMLTIATDRFDGRLIAVSSAIRQDMAAMDAGIRVTLTEGLSGVRKEMSAMHADLIRWSFVFWIGQVAATAAIVSFMLRTFPR
jgi:hypothetical protein